MNEQKIMKRPTLPLWDIDHHRFYTVDCYENIEYHDSEEKANFHSMRNFYTYSVYLEDMIEEYKVDNERLYWN